MRLIKRSAGAYETEDGRYLVERQDNYTDCEHPLCDTLHRRFHERVGLHGWAHMVPYVSWHVWDNKHNDYAAHEQFDTKIDAVAWLTSHLASSS